MADHSNTTIVALLAVVLVITVVGTTMSVNKLGAMGGKYTQLTGADVLSDAGTTAITIDGEVSINLDDDGVNFGTGYVDPNVTYAVLDTFVAMQGCSYGGADSSGGSGWYGWSEAACPAEGDLRMILNNTGTVPVIVTATATDQASAESWLCQGGACTSATAKLDILAMEGIGYNSCTVNGALNGVNADVYQPFLTNGGEAAPVLCTEFLPDAGNDVMMIWFNATIPSDAATGAHSAQVTFTAADATV